MPIKVAIGRFGPYVQYGAKKYASLKKEDDPYTVTLERALEIIREKQTIEANRIIMEFGDTGIQVLNGRYGPYITDSKKNAKIPKDREPHTLTLDECRALLAVAPDRSKHEWLGSPRRRRPRRPKSPQRQRRRPHPPRRRRQPARRPPPRQRHRRRKTPAKK